jgi:hypothetical protein
LGYQENNDRTSKGSLHSRPSVSDLNKKKRIQDLLNKAKNMTSPSASKKESDKEPI